MATALALLEYDSVAVGVLAVDRMLKRSPLTLLRCGTVHPGHYLVLVGGSVAATEEAWSEGLAVGGDDGLLRDHILLPDPHPALAEAVAGARSKPEGTAVGVVELSSSPSLLRWLDTVLKAMPVHLVEARLADDLGGHAVAVIDGDLADVQEAVERTGGCLGKTGRIVGVSLMPRVDDTLREVLAEGSRFAGCRQFQPEGGETVEETACSWDG
jgi:microcompartment protein CcmL/EutN